MTQLSRAIWGFEYTTVLAHLQPLNAGRLWQSPKA